VADAPSLQKLQCFMPRIISVRYCRANKERNIQRNCQYQSHASHMHLVIAHSNSQTPISTPIRQVITAAPTKTVHQQLAWSSTHILPSLSTVARLFACSAVA
jgi:hypothetical protein